MLKCRLVLSLFAGVAVLAALLFWPSSEPHYQGRAVTKWLQDYGTNNWPVKGSECEKAIQHFGTNALPYLIRCIKDRPLPPYNSTNGFIRKISSQNFIARRMNENFYRGRGAMWAFQLLGSNAQPAVPMLLNCLEDKAAVVRYRAICVLGDLKLNPETVIPRLLRRLAKDPDPKLRDYVIASIKSYGTAGTRYLDEAKNSPDSELRGVATNIFIPDTIITILP